MTHSTTSRIFLFSLVLLTVSSALPLDVLFNNLVKKQNDIRNAQLMAFIRQAVPQGIDPPNPKIAEYETFKSDKSANFVSDQNGNVVFRQFRRMRLADIFQRRNRGAGI